MIEIRGVERRDKENERKTGIERRDVEGCIKRNREGVLRRG